MSSYYVHQTLSKSESSRLITTNDKIVNQAKLGTSQFNENKKSGGGDAGTIFIYLQLFCTT